MGLLDWSVCRSIDAMSGYYVSARTSTVQV